jgi:3-(3-hydroxy-phenyl)propionate hydroxylase
MLEEQDPATRKKRHDDLRRTASDPDAAREFLMNSSMIRALEKAAVLG